MKYTQKTLGMGLLFCIFACVPLLAQAAEETDLKVTIQPTNATISVNATNIPATVTIENVTKDYIQFTFAAEALMGEGSNVCDRIKFEIPPGGKVRIRELWSTNLIVPTIKLKPGEKYIANVNLGKFLDFTEIGEYEVGFKGNIRIRGGDEKYGHMKSGRVVSFHGVIKVIVK